MVQDQQQGSSAGADRFGSSPDEPDLKSRLKDAADNLKEKAAHTADDARKRAEDYVGSRQGTLASQIEHLSGAMGAAASKLEESGAPEEITDMARGAEKRMEALSASLENKSPREIYHVTETMARQQPLMFFAGATLLGLLAGRFIRASQPRPEPEGSAQAYPGGDSGAR